MKVPNVLLDFDGYPTEEWLEFIRAYRPSEECTIKDFVALLMDGWWAPDWGFILHGKYKGCRRLELHTGGWSGNEDIITVIICNMYLIHGGMAYYQWRTGGHYYFKIKW